MAGDVISTGAFWAFLCGVIGAVAGVFGGIQLARADRDRLEEELTEARRHTCTGCYANEIETCGELCVDCTFDAEQATGNAQPVVDEARRKKFGPS